jgi:Kef-type K+ transport system membrane component KefB
MFGRTSEKGQLEQGINALAYGFFVPIFFVNIGLTVNARELHSEALWFVVAIIVIAILGKLIGAALGARLGGFGWQEAIPIGVGMIPRGEVTLIIASLGSEVGLVSPRVFSALVAVVLVSTLVTPSLLRLASSLQTKFSQNKERKPHSQTQPADGSLPWQSSQAERPHSLGNEERKK